MKIKNSITINVCFDVVFDRTNDIENWTNLFSEYKEAKIIKREGDWIFFQLTTHPDKNQKIRSWKSERFIDKKNKTIRAKRCAAPKNWTPK